MNNTLTKAEVVKILASQTNESQRTVETVVEALIKTITHSLATSRRVELRGFGIWETRMSKARVGRNPKHPELGQVNIPSRPVVRFKVGKDLKSAVQALAPAETPAAAPNQA